MTKDDIRIKAVETALEWSKQIITLASGVLVLSATFMKDIFGVHITDTGFLIASWSCLCVSILFGLLFLGSLCSILSTKEPSGVSIYSKPAQFLGFIHFIAFFLALVFFAIFAFENIIAVRG